MQPRDNCYLDSGISEDCVVSYMWLNSGVDEGNKNAEKGHHKDKDVTSKVSKTDPSWSLKIILLKICLIKMSYMALVFSEE